MLEVGIVLGATGVTVCPTAPVPQVNVTDPPCLRRKTSGEKNVFWTDTVTWVPAPVASAVKMIGEPVAPVEDAAIATAAPSGGRVMLEKAVPSPPVTELAGLAEQREARLELDHVLAALCDPGVEMI